MIRTERHGDVVRYELSSVGSRLTGYSVSVYMVRGVLVDCGFPGVRDDVAALLRLTRPSGVVLTHHHEDHAGNAELVARAGIPIAAHPATLAALALTHPLALYRRVAWGSPEALQTPVVPFAPEELELVHTPGHTEDHLVVWAADSRTLLASDLFLGVRVRVSHEREEPSILLDSLRRVAALGPRRMFDAHRGLIAEAEGALRAKITWLEETIGEITRLAAEGVDDGRIARMVLGAPGVIDVFSAGEYSRRNLVRAVRRSTSATAALGR